MKDLRSVLFICCICAVISAVVRMISPQKMQKEMSLICTIVLIICVMSAMLGTKFSAVERTIFDEDARVSNYALFVLSETKHSMENELVLKLKSCGICPLNLVIQCDYDEYNYIKAEQVTITLDDGSDTDHALRIAQQQFPDCDIEVIT